ncbi:MAG TPA: TadE/TadG family type IV pilus assembly protein [Chloroflexaceae bacterium]|nr:TadE/TadG family type IV pilus assembly protein [Chloroflexaceae bacterium]
MMPARSPRRTSGQSLVEFALVIGLLLFIVCAAFDAFQVVLTQATVADAASAAAHQAALLGGDDGPGGMVEHAAQRVLAGGLTTGSGDAVVSVRCEEPCQRYQPIHVRVRFEDARWFPIFSARMLIEREAVRASEKDRSATFSLP